MAKLQRKSVRHDKNALHCMKFSFLCMKCLLLMLAAGLFRRIAIAEICHNSEYHVRHPCRECRRCAGIYGECRADCLQHYVYEAEGQSYAKIHAHAAFAFPRRERYAYYGEDKRGKGGGYSLVILHLILHYVF